MRLFVAINTDDILRDKIVEIIIKIRTQTIRGNFTRPENLHLTLSFLGEIQPERVVDITDVMDRVGRVNNKKFSLALTELGKFNDTWWIGIKKNNSLWWLQENLSDSLRRRGFKIQKRPFRPHLTVCRKPVFSADFDEAALQSVLGPMIRDLIWDVDRFDLMLSERIDGRMKYSVLHSTELTGPSLH